MDCLTAFAAPFYDDARGVMVVQPTFIAKR